MYMKLLKNKKVLLVGFIVLLGLFIHLYYANNLPLTNDESSYLYDTLNIRNGLIPLKDFLTKSLPFIYLLTLSQSIFGNSIFVGRLLMIVISLFTSLLLYFFARDMLGKKIAIISGLIYWAFPLIAAYTTQIHTEPLQVLCVILSYLFLFRFRVSKKLHHLLFSAIAMTIAFFVRQSSIVLILLPALFEMFSKILFKSKFLKLPIYFFAITSVLISLVTIFAYNYFGGGRTLELVGGGAANLAIQEKGSLGIKEIITYPFKFGLEAIVEANNLFRDGLILLSFALLTLFYYFLAKRNKIEDKFKTYGFASIFLIFIFSMYQFRYHLFSGLWKVDMIPQVNLLFLTIVLTLLTFSHVTHRNSLSPKYFKIFNSQFYKFLILWIIILLGIYLLWIKFRSPYLIEFFPPLLILFSIGITSFIEDINLITNKVYKKSIRLILILFTIVSFTTSFYMNKNIYFTGLFLPAEVEEITNYIKSESPSKDTILTALAILPYLSDDEVIYNISHPAWYGYTNIRRDVFLLYFPPVEKLLELLKNRRVKFIIREPFTDASYFRYKDIREQMEVNYSLVKTVGRATIYKIKDE